MKKYLSIINFSYSLIYIYCMRSRIMKISHHFQRIGLFSNKPIHLGSANSLFFLFKDQSFVSVFSHRQFFTDEEISIELLTSQTNLPTPIYKHWFFKNTQEKHFELLIHCDRWLRINSLQYYFVLEQTKWICFDGSTYSTHS